MYLTVSKYSIIKRLCLDERNGIENLAMRLVTPVTELKPEDLPIRDYLSKRTDYFHYSLPAELSLLAAGMIPFSLFYFVHFVLTRGRN